MHSISKGRPTSACGSTRRYWRDPNHEVSLTKKAYENENSCRRLDHVLNDRRHLTLALPTPSNRTFADFRSPCTVSLLCRNIMPAHTSPTIRRASSSISGALALFNNDRKSPPGSSSMTRMRRVLWHVTAPYTFTVWGLRSRVIASSSRTNALRWVSPRFALVIFSPSFVDDDGQSRQRGSKRSLLSKQDSQRPKESPSHRPLADFIRPSKACSNTV